MTMSDDLSDFKMWVNMNYAHQASIVNQLVDEFRKIEPTTPPNTK